MNLVVQRNKLGKFSLFDRCSGKSCILGHLALALGYSQEEVENADFDGIVGLPDAATKFPAELFSNPFRYEIMSVNDSNSCPNKKEEQLISMFKKCNINLSFVD